MYFVNGWSGVHPFLLHDFRLGETQDRVFATRNEDDYKVTVLISGSWLINLTRTFYIKPILR